MPKGASMTVAYKHMSWLELLEAEAGQGES